ncbi:MAG: ribosomal small subunit methyltransferase [Chlorobi bacterium]|nr:ribosomal small subunit methyltransferase [Chlorobiota bacterium]
MVFFPEAMDHIVPKKSLGQNFLVDRNIAQKIVREFDPKEGELVVEIGPGEGALTGLLLESGCRLIAVELDPRAAEKVRQLHGTRIEVVEGDILRLDLRDLAQRRGCGRIRVIGNIPYYITSPILFHLIGYRDTVSDAMLMMQREVADRLAARPRTKDYGILSVITQTYSEPKRLFDVGPRCFFPAPKVTSAIVRLRFRDLEGITGIEERHRQLVRAAFSQRRKTLRNSLSQLLSDQHERASILGTAGIDEGERAEELAPGDFIRLARIYSDALESRRGEQEA